ncbi:uncharacterized protein A1O9_10277 [Exophiala aquamarina CBS 119918]|uniref:Alcohol dehydrogenase n=1 Tax=Exophiala aquamarina CBS 119918 TaxID=1182545 RepID=A0A072PE99_9EURO|nr:uncharacterized protein A1O9_10277 [Exophiala aquamarina CBS 119918]KEF53875.1 hypothetical protein A1O9_10277 [Exophiala aquamarina CBS 119918]
MSAFFDIAEDEIQGLEDMVAIITGGSSGIGFATSELFSSKGSVVIQADLNPPPRTLPRSHYVKTDVTSWKDLTSLFLKVIDDHGKVDVVFANAGVAPRANYLQLASEDNGDLIEPTTLCLDINLVAVANTVALALHYMQKQESGGSVIMTTSVAGRCLAGLSSPEAEEILIRYAAGSKHGVVGILRGVREHLYPNVPIRINAVAPSWTATPIILLPHAAFEKVGLSVQPPSKVALAVGLLVADPTRHAQTIYCVNGRYKELEEEVMAATAIAMGFETVEKTEAGKFQDLIKEAQAGIIPHC